MRNPLADKVVEIKPSGIRKFFDIVSEMKDAISLGVGEPDFDTPWHIRAEGILSLEKGKTFYKRGSVSYSSYCYLFLNFGNIFPSVPSVTRKMLPVEVLHSNWF